MKITLFVFRAAILALFGVLVGAGVTARAADAPYVNTAIVPAVRDVPQHRQFVELARQGGIDVLFLGDSITDWWREENPVTRHNGKQVFDKYFGSMKVANFGIAGDTTQQVLWRLQNGEGEGFQPKVVMLMIGTNNLSRNTNPEIVEGVTAVVNELRQRFPAAKILLLGIFPRGDKGTPARDRIPEINLSIAKLNDLEHVFYLDIGSKFLGLDGILPGDIMPDKLHPSSKGYEIWAEAVKGPLANLLKLADEAATATATK